MFTTARATPRTSRNGWIAAAAMTSGDSSAATAWSISWRMFKPLGVLVVRFDEPSVEGAVLEQQHQ